MLFYRIGNDKTLFFQCLHIVDKQSGLVEKIKEIIDPHTVGDPERLLLWTSKSVKHIQSALKESGYKISHELVRQILSSQGYNLQTNRKVFEGGEHIDRDAQFEGKALKFNISEITKEFVVLIRLLVDWKKVTNFVACFSKQQAPIIVRPM
jgi:hypothetical protein